MRENDNSGQGYRQSLLDVTGIIGLSNFLLISLLICGLALTPGCKQAVSGTAKGKPTHVRITNIPANLPWSDRMALSIMKRNPESWMTDFRESPKWNYTQGLVLHAIQHLHNARGKQEYYDYVKSYADTMITAEGEILEYQLDEYNIDHINPGKILFQLYEDTEDKKYLIAMQTLRRQLQWQPRTRSNGYWHKLKYTWQMWLDGLYMGAPYYAQFAEVFDEPEAFDDVANQFILMEKYSRDAKTGLLYHGYDESRVQRWSNPESGCSPHFWGRAVGWYMMGLVDALDFIPEDHPKRGELIAILKRASQAVASVQDPETGLWYQILNMPEAEGNYLEASASTMFAYAIAKGTNKGYLDKKMMEVGKRGFEGLIDNLVEVMDDGQVVIHQCCAVAGLGGEPYRDGSFEYYIGEEIRDNDPKATGPFILAALEFEKMGYNF